MLTASVALASAFTAPLHASSRVGGSNVVMHGGKGFGGSEATRDPAPTVYDNINNPKSKQTAIHKAESFAEYIAKRNLQGTDASDAVSPSAVVAPPSAYMAPGFSGDEATRDPAPAVHDLNEQRVIHEAETYAEYLAKRNNAGTEPSASAAPPPVPMPPPIAAVAATSKPMSPPVLSAADKAAVLAQQAADSALPPLAPGAIVTFNRPDDAWLAGRTATVRGFDSAQGVYYVWLPHEPTGTEDALTKPILMRVRRSHLELV